MDELKERLERAAAKATYLPDSNLMFEAWQEIAELEAQIERLSTPTHHWIDGMQYAEEDLYSVLDEEFCAGTGATQNIEVSQSHDLGWQTYKVWMQDNQHNGYEALEQSDG